MRKAIFCCVAALFMSATAVFAAETPVKDLVGNYSVGPVSDAGPVEVPYIFWGDVAVVGYANGGPATKPDSIYGKLGLNIKMTAGDDFLEQVRRYMKGASPFLRGTMSQIGQVSEVINSDPRTKPVVVSQMTWSTGGDNMVVREGIKNISDLRGATIVLQNLGPHVGMLDDILRTAGMTWDDITVIWAKDITGTEDSPAALFRKDPSIKACFVITPDMIGLTSGRQNTGSGAEGTVKGAHVLVSTADLSHSIADVWVVRQDYFSAHRDVVEKMVAGYFKGVEDVLVMKKQYETSGSKDYMAVLQLLQNTYGKEAIPTLEEDAHGLILDCELIGYAANVEFFTNPKSPIGFTAMTKNALDLATSRGFATVRAGLVSADFDYSNPVLTSLLKNTAIIKPAEKFKAEAVQSEIEKFAQGGFDDNTIYSFTISFDANQTDFSAERYGVEFQKVVELASKYGNAVFAVVGHVDPTKTLAEMVQAGLQKGVLKKTTANGKASYSLNGQPLNITSSHDVNAAIESGAFDGVAEHNPRQVMQAALNVSRERANQARQALLSYATAQGLPLDPSQIQPVGMGVRDPFIAVPHNEDEAAQNRRVEFSILRGVDPETVMKSDFDLLGGN